MENSNCDQLSVKTEENDPKSQDIKIESETLQEITNAAMANAKTITNALPTFTSADLNALETMYISTNDRLNTASSSITATSADTSEIGSEPGSTKKSSQKTKKLKEKTKKTKGKKKKHKKEEEESDEDARRLEEFLGTDKSVTYDTNAYELL